MPESLSELLRRGADSVAAPGRDLGELVAAAARRRRRRYVALATAAAALTVLVAGSLLVTRAGIKTEEPPTVVSPSSHPPTGVRSTRQRPAAHFGSSTGPTPR